jgi:hypothetical protein
MTPVRIDPQLEQAMQTHPDLEFSLLLSVDRTDASRQQALTARGAFIRRSLTLVPTFAVTCTGSAGLSLLTLPWVRRIEEDRPVYAL